MGGTLLEGAAVDALVEVDGVFAGDNVLEGRTGLAGLYIAVQGIGAMGEYTDRTRRPGRHTDLFGGGLGGLRGTIKGS